MDLEFEDGRALVELADGHLLSIINHDREDVLFNAGFYSGIHAKEGNYEVAILKRNGVSSDFPDDRLSEDWLLDEDFYIYCDVTIEQIEAYVNLIAEEAE